MDKFSHDVHQKALEYLVDDPVPDLVFGSDWRMAQTIRKAIKGGARSELLAIKGGARSALLELSLLVQEALESSKKSSKKKAIAISDILASKNLKDIQAGVALCKYPEEATIPAEKACLPLLVSVENWYCFQYFRNYCHEMLF